MITVAVKMIDSAQMFRFGCWGGTFRGPTTRVLASRIKCPKLSDQLGKMYKNMSEIVIFGWQAPKGKWQMVATSTEH